MKKLNVLVVGLLLPLLAAAQIVKSPNGNVSVTFSLTGNGQPTYEMSYKGKTVCKPSHLGLELAKDKHASKGMTETNLMDSPKQEARPLLLMKHGSLYGVRLLPFATIITKWR